MKHKRKDKKPVSIGFRKQALREFTSLGSLALGEMVGLVSYTADEAVGLHRKKSKKS